MANVAAIRIEQTRFAEVEQARQLMARDLEQAAEIQQGFLPFRRACRCADSMWPATTPPAAPSAAIITISSLRKQPRRHGSRRRLR
jgi:hypothetical protein